MANMKSHIICILDTSIPSKIFKSMKDSHMFYNKHHISRVNTPNDLLGWINAGPQFKIEYYIISTHYYKIEAFKRRLTTIKDKHIICIV